MNHISLHERALTAAMSYVVGDEARAEIENLYAQLAAAEQAGYQEGFKLGQEVGSAQEDEARVQGYDKGYAEGYADAHAVFAGDAQPVIKQPYEGDSGDEGQKVEPKPFNQSAWDSYFPR